MTKEYTYDISGKRESIIAKSGGTAVQNLTYTYNTLEQMTAGGGATYQYDANGNITKNTRVGFGDICMNYTYNRDRTVKNVIRTEDWGNDSPYIIEYGYTYYLDGNLKTDAETYRATKTYTYNSRNMLESESLSTGISTTYQYDNSGNMTRRSTAIPGAYMDEIIQYTYDESNRLISKTIDESNVCK